MLELKIGERKLNIKYGYEATLKSRLLSRMAKKEEGKGAENDMEATEDLLLFLPELLLVGLQKFHSDEYGFDPENKDGKEEMAERMFPLIEEYFDENDGEDAITLYNSLTGELLQNGFLKSQFQKELEKLESGQKAVSVKPEGN